MTTRRCVLGMLPALAWPGRAQYIEGKGEVPFVPSPEEVIEAMLKLASVTPRDVVYDLGCGDGRIVVMAARQLGARSVGIDIDPDRIQEARENVAQNKVESRVKLIEQNLFDADLSEATVVTLYLLSSVNLKLRPKLQKELKPGARVVSHQFDMGDWKPEKRVLVGGRPVMLWRV
ncbi:MAG: 50S ribosomal protein L11 methyltransferase [Bryobacterales bacterium]|nr:50S ribosomal protein L11 methyltransferase [Bryobacterales bacterium]